METIPRRSREFLVRVLKCNADTERSLSADWRFSSRGFANWMGGFFGDTIYRRCWLPGKDHGCVNFCTETARRENRGGHFVFRFIARKGQVAAGKNRAQSTKSTTPGCSPQNGQRLPPPTGAKQAKTHLAGLIRPTQLIANLFLVPNSRATSNNRHTRSAQNPS